MFIYRAYHHTTLGPGESAWKDVGASMARKRLRAQGGVGEADAGGRTDDEDEDDDEAQEEEAKDAGENEEESVEE